MDLDALHRNNVVVHGPQDGQPMVFAHGFGCDQNMWRYVWPAFAEDYRIVLSDHRTTMNERSTPPGPLRRLAIERLVDSRGVELKLIGELDLETTLEP